MKSKQKQCPNCFGGKEVYNGKDYIKCTICKGKGKISTNKQYNPINDNTDLSFNDSLNYDNFIEED